MGKHFDNLSEYLPSLNSARILDVGSGRGGFLVDAVKRGARAVGLEKNSEYVKISQELAKKMM